MEHSGCSRRGGLGGGGLHPTLRVGWYRVVGRSVQSGGCLRRLVPVKPVQESSNGRGRGLSGKNEDVSNFLGIGELIPGKNIILTIDKFVQHISERAIKDAVRYNNAKQGMAIVLDTETGQILALAKYPNFDPNFYYNYSYFVRRNFTIIDSFEPGSTLKIIALSALLENNPSTMKSIFRCDGKIDIADATINCTGVHGTLGITDIIRQSCNIGIIEAMRKIKKKELNEKLRIFGFGSKTNAGMPGETEGILRNYNNWSGLSKFSMSITPCNQYVFYKISESVEDSVMNVGHHYSNDFCQSCFFG